MLDMMKPLVRLMFVSLVVVNLIKITEEPLNLSKIVQ